MLLGYSPEFLAAANWVIASVVAGFAAIIIGPFGGSLSPVQLTSLLGFFLAAMLIAKLSSPMMATVGGLGLGMIFTWSGSWLISQGWFPLWMRTGVKEAIPLVAIVIILFMTGKSCRSEAPSRRSVSPSLPIRSGWCPTPSSGAPW